MRFDTKETEGYYYSRLTEIGIIHATVDEDHIYTMNDVIKMTDALEKVMKSF